MSSQAAFNVPARRQDCVQMTGASKGIGAAMARAMAEFGASVVLSSMQAGSGKMPLPGNVKDDGLEATVH